MALDYHKQKFLIDYFEFKIQFLIGCLSVFVSFSSAIANRLKDPNFPISHCYHWVNEDDFKFLTYKYEYARRHQGELTNFTTPKTSFGAKAGPGLYCAKTPAGSWTYGNRVIRIDFIEDVVFERIDKSEKICGIDVTIQDQGPDCQNRATDVLLYHLRDEFYVIKNLNVIKKWAAYSPQVIEDLNGAILEVGQNSLAGEHLRTTLNRMRSDSYKFTEVEFINENRRASGAQNVSK